MEDEPLNCTTNSQPSCGAWHFRGARIDGLYTIRDFKHSESFSVECQFNRTEGLVTTSIHNSLEDWTVIEETWFIYISYDAPFYFLSYIKSFSTGCYQDVHFQCLQTNYFISHLNMYTSRRSMNLRGGCNCDSTDGACPRNISRCGCDMDRKDWIGMDDANFLTDSIYVDNMELLPFYLLIARETNGHVRLKAGPLVCYEKMSESPPPLLCKSGVIVDAAHRCILDYDIYHYHTGCRDLTHLQDCENFQCPTDFIKCPSSYCIPIRLVCDEHPDCIDSMDERNCGNVSCPGRFRCNERGVCIPWQQVCDHIKHCPGGEDEYFCNTSCPHGCVCTGSKVHCTGLSLDDIKVLQSHTRVLDISNSQIQTLPNDTFVQLGNLAILDLSNFGVYDLEEHCFSGLRNVFYLDLSLNYLKKLSVGLFRELLNLKLLNISNNAITAVTDGLFHGLQKLKSLDLRRNHIKEFTKMLFSGLNQLTHLYNDKYVFCCYRPSSVPQDQCMPQADEFSSCSDLMKNEVLKVSLWVFGFVALTGNTFTLIYRCIVDRKSLSRSNDIFIANLSISDFLMGVYMIMIASADVHFRGAYSLNDDNWRASWVCQLAGFLSAFSSETSVMFLCMITLDRVLVIKYPFTDFRFTFQRMARYLCPIVWLIGILLAGIPLLPLAYFSGSFYSRSGVCLALPLTRDRPPGWEYSTSIFIFWNFVCFCIIALGQAVIYHAVKKSQRIRKGKTTNDMVLARKLSFIVITDFVCWFPVCVMGLMALSGYVITSEVYAWVAVFVLPINSALNPVIYTLSSIDAMRKKKNVKDLSVTTQGTASSKVTVFRLIRFLCLTQPPNSMCLTAYLRLLSSARNLNIIVEKLAETFELVHALHMVCSDITSDQIFVVVDNGVVRTVLLKCDPKAAHDDEEFAKDILDFGNLVTNILRAYTLAKLRPVQETTRF